MNKVQQFIHEVFGEVRIIPSESGNQMETLFCATDVARVLEYKNPYDAINNHCTRYLVFCEVPHPQNTEKTINMKFINLQGLFALSFGSQMKEAQKFRDWICNDILPSLYQYGTVTLDNHEDTPKFTNPIYTPSIDDFDSNITNKENQYGYHEKENIEVPPHLSRLFNQEYKEMSFEDKRILWSIYNMNCNMLGPIYNKITSIENQIHQCADMIQYVKGKPMIVPAKIIKKED